MTDALPRAFYALGRNAVAVTEDEQAVIVRTDDAGLLAEFSRTTDAACLLRAEVELPTGLYALLDALIGVSDGSIDWFEATDARLAKRAGRSMKWVQRHRDELTAWQQLHNYNLVDIADHYTGSDLRRHPHKYRLHLHRLALDTRMEAEGSPHWSDPKRRGYAMQSAARRVCDSIPGWAPRRQRGRRREPDAQAIINSSLKAAATKLERALALLDGIEVGGLVRGLDIGVRVEPSVVGRIHAALAGLEGHIGAPEPGLPSEPEGLDIPTGQNVHKGNCWSKMNFGPSAATQAPPHEEQAEVIYER